MPTIITAGGASDGLGVAAGNDGVLILQTGPSGAKVDALTLDATGKFTKAPIGSIVQCVEATPIVALVTGSVAIPYDDTIPQITEGTTLITAPPFTPRMATNRLLIAFDGVINCSTAGGVGTVALFQDAIANAIAARGGFGADSGKSWNCGFSHEMVAGTVSPITFQVRFGPDAGTAYINGNAARKYGGVQAARLRITEIQA